MRALWLVLLWSGLALAQPYQGIPMVSSQAPAAPPPRLDPLPAPEPVPAPQPAPAPPRPSSCPTVDHPKPEPCRPPEQPGNDYDYYNSGDYQPSYSMPAAPAVASPPKTPTTDPRSQLAYRFRAVIVGFVREHSVAGAFWLKDPQARSSWLLHYAGPFRYQLTPGALSVVVPFRGRLGRDPREHRVDVSFRFASGSFAPQLLGADIVAIDGYPR